MAERPRARSGARAKSVPDTPPADALPYVAHFTPFGDLFGLEAPVRVLWGALERDQVAGSYVLRGPTGVGKTALALAFAQAAACLSPLRDPYRACEVCESCRRVARGAQPEIVLVQPAGDQTQIWQFWDRERRPDGVLEHALPYSPSLGRKRVFIIERADTLNQAAANSILKVLEEPPPYAVFLLLTPSVERLLPTILSRCQVVTVRPPERRAIGQWLVERHGAPPERAAALVALAEGLPGMALRLVRNPETVAGVEQCALAALRLAQAEPLAALRIAEELRSLAGRMQAARPAAESEPDNGGDDAPTTRSRVDRGGLGAVLDVVITVFRDILFLSLGPDSAEVVHRDHSDELRTCAARAEAGHWLGALEILGDARRRLEQNVSPQLITDWVATAIAGGRT
jgi:DNA polymerase-3 subunit delta'